MRRAKKKREDRRSRAALAVGFFSLFTFCPSGRKVVSHQVVASASTTMLTCMWTPSEQVYRWFLQFYPSTRSPWVLWSFPYERSNGHPNTSQTYILSIGLQWPHPFLKISFSFNHLSLASTTNTCKSCAFTRLLNGLYERHRNKEEERMLWIAFAEK